MSIHEPILLVGYTARMLAELATRAGYRVTALDYFGDSDLRASAPSLSLLRNFDGKAYSPRALAAAARRIDARAVVYGASFENHPKLVADLAVGRQLLGNTPETLTRARDPFALFDALRAAGFATPRTQAAGAPLDGGRWLWKPARGGGGSGVRWPDGAAPAEGIAQEFIEGLPCSFTFVADGRESLLIGLSEQLIGLDAFGSGGFRWCGNLVPPRAPAAEIDAMQAEAGRMATHLTRHFALRGLNTVDFIWRAGRIWTLELNPRPSASAELFERVLNLRLFDAHVRGATGQLPAHVPVLPGRRAAGKAVLFARADARVGDTGGWLAQGLRDIPHPGEAIAKGHPICTLLAEGETPDAVFDLLLAKAGRVESWLRPPHATEISSL